MQSDCLIQTTDVLDNVFTWEKMLESRQTFDDKCHKNVIFDQNLLTIKIKLL